MKLTLTRITRTDKSTIGSLSVDGENECFILEDVDRSLNNAMSLDDILKIKVFGKTAIPAGSYQVAITYSDRFKKSLPLLLNVPGFSGVRIHSGNRPADTEGCLLTGEEKQMDSVSNSRSAFDKLFSKMEACSKNEKIIITIQ